MSMPSGMLLFPSEKETISSYLIHHPSTRNLKIRQSETITSKIIEITANYFSNRGFFSDGIKIHLYDLLYPLNKKLLKLSELEMSSVQEKLVKALIDCANGKKINLEEKDRK